MVLGHVGRLQFREDGDLLNDVVDFIFGVFDVDDLDCDRFAGPPINSNIEEK